MCFGGGVGGWRGLITFNGLHSSSPIKLIINLPRRCLLMLLYQLGLLTSNLYLMLRYQLHRVSTMHCRDANNRPCMAEPKNMAPLQAVEKKDGHHFVNKEMKRMMLQWTWRQTVLPCSPKDMMTHLVKLLERHDGWIPSCKNGIVWGHVKNHKINAFSNGRKVWNHFSQWQGDFSRAEKCQIGTVEVPGKRTNSAEFVVLRLCHGRHISLKEAIHPQLEGHSRHFKTKQTGVELAKHGGETVNLFTNLVCPFPNVQSPVSSNAYSR